jgi:two-component system, chemotaxis family, protein-glutamate methylesterase/glutaminase
MAGLPWQLSVGREQRLRRIQELIEAAPDMVTTRKNAATGHDIVAIGASAGGLRALIVILSGLRESFPAPVMVVQHLDPHRESQMAGILGRHAPIKVVEAVDGSDIAPGIVYIAPPGQHMLVEQDHIRLTTTELVHFVRPSVDLLFESIAAQYGDKAIGVILTGSGTDGATGVRAIKERSGFVIVQDPDTAESAGMPHAAIATGLADTVLPLEEIADALENAVAVEG